MRVAVFESSKPCSTNEFAKPSVNRHTARRTTVSAARSVAVLEEMPMHVLGCDSEDDVHTADCEEAACNVSTMVWPSTSADFEMPTTPVHSPAVRAALAVSPFYRLCSSSPSTPNRSFISGAFTSPGGSSVSTTTSVSHDSFRDYKRTNGGPVTSTPNSQKSKLRGDDVEVRVGGGFGGEVGKVRRESGECKAGVPADSIARKEEVALKSLSQNAPKESSSHRHTRGFGKLVRKIVPSKRFKVPVPVPHPHLPLVPRPDIPLAATSNPQRNRKWALPADLPVSPGKVGPWRLYVPGAGLVSPNKPNVSGG